MRRHQRIALLAILLLAPHSAAGSSRDIRLNEVQVLGSHNSYHIQPEDRILTVLGLFDAFLPISLEYTHAPLPEQFSNQGIRQIELDIFADPEGGLYANRGAFLVFQEDPASGIPELDEPGLKVLHVQDVDFDTRCLTFVLCLEDIKAWSDANPKHLPILILVEAKDDVIPDPLNLDFAIPIPFGPAELDTIDSEILTVFAIEQIITPDDVRGSHATLEDAILEDGWPTLRESRGKVMFALDNGGGVRADYEAGHPSLSGRILFTSAPPGSPEAAFLKLNNPFPDGQEIAMRASQGYLIRTRADADTVNAREGDTAQRDVALMSGAHFVSTDYPVPDPFGMGYVVAIPGGSPGRCNPVTGPRHCRSEHLENLTGEAGLRGRRLVVRDQAGDVTRRKIVAASSDPALETPLPGSPNDPSSVGAQIELRNPVSGESARFFLPPGDHWRALGNGDRGWMYRDRSGENGPCVLLIAKHASSLRVTCSGKRGPIPFSLNEPSQGQLDFSLRFGEDTLHCLSFGGDIAKDTPAADDLRGIFVARNAPPGTCPTPD